jgi:hypothetical protein
VIANVMVSKRDEFDDLLEWGSLKKTLRVRALMKRFLGKCCGIPIASGPLTSVELEPQMEWWIRRVQSCAEILNWIENWIVGYSNAEVEFKVTTLYTCRIWVCSQRN